MHEHRVATTDAQRQWRMKQREAHTRERESAACLYEGCKKESSTSSSEVSKHTDSERVRERESEWMDEIFFHVAVAGENVVCATIILHALMVVNERRELR